MWIGYEELLQWETQGEDSFLMQPNDLRAEKRQPTIGGQAKDTRAEPLGIIAKWLHPLMQDFEWNLAKAAADMTLRQNLANRVPLELSYQPPRWDLF